MALIHYEHFDLYGGSKDALALRSGHTMALQSNANHSIVTSPRNGSHSYRLLTTTNVMGLFWALPSNKTVIGQGAAFFLESLGSTTANFSPGLRFVDTAGGGATGAGTIRVLPNANGGITVWLNTTQLASSANGIVSTGSWFWLEAKVTSGASSTGVVEVRLNGDTTPIILAENVNIPNAFTHVGLYASGNGGNGNFAATVRFDDWVVWDDTDTVNNNFMGDTFVLVSDPDSDAASPNNDFVPSTGSDKFALVDEATPNDADFITANATNDVQEFGHVALNLPVGAVSAIASQVRAFKTDAGSSEIEVGISSNGQNSMGAGQALATGPTVRSHIANRNPDGNVPWTQSAAQAARLRMRRSA
jgi:hypothetical protein